MAVDNYLEHLTIIFDIYLNEPLNSPLQKFFYFGNEDSNITHFVPISQGIIENHLPPNIAFVQGISNEIIFIAKEIWKNGLFVSKFIVDDAKTTEEAAKNSDGLIVREQNRNYLRLEENFIEIITRADAEFLYREGRIKNFALFEPTDFELAELKNFCKPNYADIVVFNH